MQSVVTTWGPFLPPLLVTLALLSVPGLAVGLALRLRGWLLAAVAAPISVSLIVVAATISGWTPLRWSVLWVIALTLVAVVAGLAWSRWVGAERPVARATSRGRAWPSVIAVAAPAAMIGAIVTRGMGDPALVAQRYDNFFHINAIQYVLDTGNASPFWLGSMTSPGSLLFYPSGWHAVGSLVAQLSGSAVPEASNALVLIVAALVWPVSAVFLARTLFGSGALVTVTAGALSAGTPAFPYLPLHYGPLYPLFLGLALAPVAVALAVKVLRPHRVFRRQDLVLLLVLVVPGVAVAHPGALLGAIALSVPAAAMLGWWCWRRAASTKGRAVVIVSAVAVLSAGAVLLALVRPPASQIYWPVTGSLATAVGEVITAAVFNYPVAYVFATLLFIGAIVSVVRPTYLRLTAFGMGVVGGVLYIIVAGAPFEVLRTWFTGPWYNNAPRLASIWALAAVPLAAAGATFVLRWLHRMLRRAGWGRRLRMPRPIALIAIVAVLMAAMSTANMRQASDDVHFVYGGGAGSDGPILSAGEYRLLDRLDEEVPKDAVIAGDPWTGTSFAYGVSGRQVLMPHLLMEESKAAHTINTEFADKGDSPAMCTALRETGVRYILDFDGPDFMPSDGDFDGVTSLQDSDFVELVDSEPGARLYRITSCGLAK